MRRPFRYATALLAALTIAAPTALAGPFDDEIVEIIDAAVADWTILLSCSILERDTHEILLDMWEDERGAVEALLEEAEIAPKLADELSARLAPELLLTPTMGDAPALVTLCYETEWRRQAVMFTFTRPATAIRDLLP